MPGPTRRELVVKGQATVMLFCELNGWPIPRIETHNPGRGSCGTYWRSTIYVDADSCARLGYGGPAWSWPGYVTDRTPFGVYCHELGHHAEAVLRGKVAKDVRTKSKEEPITSYCPNSSEWFAECFRLFCTNPDLLRLIRPRTHELLSGLCAPVERRDWDVVLKGAPGRTVNRAKVLIDKAGHG